MRGGRRGSPRAGTRGGSPTPTPAPRSPRAMKSARGRHRTRLAGGPATSRCGCSAEVTQQRAGHRRGQLSGRAFPRGRGAALQSAPGLSEVEPNSLRCAPAWGGCSPASFPEINFVWASSFSLPRREAAQLWGPCRCLRTRCAQPLGAIGVRVAADPSGPGSRRLVACAAQRPHLRPCLVPSAGGRQESPAPRRVGGVWAPDRVHSAGRRGACLRGARPAARPEPKAAFREAASPRPGALSSCPVAATGVGGECEGRARPGLAARERLARALLRSSAGCLGKVKLLTHRKPC